MPAVKREGESAFHVDINTQLSYMLSKQAPSPSRHMRWVFGMEMVGLGFCGDIGEVTEAA